jgi:hypothetical protein
MPAVPAQSTLGSCRRTTSAERASTLADVDRREVTVVGVTGSTTMQAAA